MTLRLSECNYEHLRPPKDVFNVQHTDHYIRHGEGKKAIRKIFANVKIYEDEQKKLKEFEELIAKEKVEFPADWTSVDTFRFMYSGKLDLKKSLKIMKQHLQWRALPERGQLRPEARRFIEDGIVYISGRDKQYRPIIIVNLYRVDLKIMNLNDLIEAMSFVFDTVRKYYFVPGKVENWIIIIELNHGGVFDFPTKVLKSINETTSVNYTSTLDKFYLMNPSSLLKKTWSLASAFIDPETAGKISMVTSKEYPQLLEKISPDQLLEKYGGTLAEIYSWPPPNTLNQPSYTYKPENEVEEVGIPINSIQTQSQQKEVTNERKNEEPKPSNEEVIKENKPIENQNPYVKTFYAQNSNETGTKDTEMIQKDKNLNAHSQEKQEQHTFPEGIERQIPEINYSSRLNEEAPLTGSFPNRNREDIYYPPAVQEEIRKLSNQDAKNFTNSYTEDDADTILRKGSFKAEDKRTLVVQKKMEKQDSSLKVLNDGTIVLSSYGENDSRKGKKTNKTAGVTFGGVEVNELSRNYSGKYSKSGNEEDGGISLEKETIQGGFCGFCKQPNNSKGSGLTGSCNIF